MFSIQGAICYQVERWKVLRLHVIQLVIAAVMVTTAV
jgi:hypothetical protein